jgi:pyruvate dehydrogenase E2 component (dihydrolipoamide acetyltransferase)
MGEITMPRLSDSMSEGTIISWLKRDGEPVAAEEDLVEIETDKATMTHASEFAGVLQILAAEGTTHPVGAVIAQVGTGAPAQAPTDSNGAETATRDLVRTAPTRTGTPGTPVEAAGNRAPDTPVESVGNGGPDRKSVRSSARATPLARRAAHAHRVDLDRLRGTGPHGRITRADVLSAAGVPAPVASHLAMQAAAPAASAPATGLVAPADQAGQPGQAGGAAASTPAGPAATVPPAAPSQDRGDTIQQPTRVQRLIARRMAEANATIPQFEVQTEVTMDGAIALRSQLKQLSDVDPPSYNDLVIKACALALVRHPRVNASYREDRFELHSRVNVGFAVAADDALIVPTVKDAETKSLMVIALETRLLAARVRSGEITPPELSDATFTVSNLGMFGMTAIRPIVNPPQVAILGVGAMRGVLARAGGQIVDRTLMTLTLTSDHRILYGADAARFLADVQSLLESPLRLML